MSTKTERWEKRIAASFPFERRQLRLHVLGLAHLPVAREYQSCAFTTKVWRFCAMMHELGHEVHLYGAEGSDAPCTEFHKTHSLDDIRQTWGDGDNRFAIGYDWQSQQFRHDLSEEPTAPTLLLLGNSSRIIKEIKRDDDILVLMQGWYHKAVMDEVKLAMVVEPGIGYRGSLAAGTYRAFESSFLMHYTYGFQKGNTSPDGSYYDRVIPNYYPSAMFPYNPVGERGDYVLFIGRLIERKGIRVAMLAAEAAGRKLLVAGQGELEPFCQRPHVEFVGYANEAKRYELMAHAAAVLVPTIYLEPFAGVHIEAMMTGAPVLTTDFGVFPETVINGFNGWRCHTLNDYVWGLDRLDELDYEAISQYAHDRFSMDTVKWQYEKWFQEIRQVYESNTVPGVKAFNLVERVNGRV